MEDIHIDILIGVVGVLVLCLVYKDIKRSKQISDYTSIRGWATIIMGIIFVSVSILKIVYKLLIYTIK